MSKLVVNAPIQNKEFSPDRNVGKVVPLFVADWLRRTDDSYHDDVYDLWNNVLASEQTGHNADSYEAKTRSLLDQKYGSEALSSLRKSTPTEILLDTDSQGFAPWTHAVIEQALSDGDIRISPVEVVACSGCDGIRAVQAECDKACGQCGETNTYRTIRRVMMTTIDHESLSLSSEAAGESVPAHGIEGDAVISKRRLGGIGLEKFGLKGLSLDPRIALGLLVTYAATKVDADEVVVVASRATASHNLAVLFSTIKSQQDELPRVSMKPIAKAPAHHIEYLRSEGIVSTSALRSILNEVIPPHLLQMKRDMTPQTFDRVAFSRKPPRA